MIPKMCLYIGVFFFVSNTLKKYSDSGDKRITVIGIALEEKDGAIVQTDKGGIYFLHKVDDWDDKYYGKKVKVTGKLITVTHEKKSTDSMAVQERVGTMQILKRPKWSLVE